MDPLRQVLAQKMLKFCHRGQEDHTELSPVLIPIELINPTPRRKRPSEIDLQ